MNNKRLNWLLVGQYEDVKVKRDISEVQEHVRQVRPTKIGCAEIITASTSADASYYSRGFKR